MVRIYLKSGETLEGLMGPTPGPFHYLLRHTDLLEAPDRTQALSGYAKVPVGNVSFYQVLPK